MERDGFQVNIPDAFARRSRSPRFSSVKALVLRGTIQVYRQIDDMNFRTNGRLPGIPADPT